MQSEQHLEIKAALERYSKEELVDLMEHLLKVYVLNEPVKLETSVQKPESIRELAGYSFTQLITLLQNNLEMEELDHFRVTPYTVMVSIGQAEFDINGPTPTLAGEAAPESQGDDDERLTPAQRLDSGIENKPWRRQVESAPAPRTSHADNTPSMADLFTGDRPGFAFFDDAPSKADDFDAPPPIAESAPGDDPAVANDSTTTDFTKAAASREDAPADQEPATPPPLAEGDTQIDPSNRYASLDLD